MSEKNSNPAGNDRQKTKPKEKKIQPRRLKGFQDYHPQVMSLRFSIMDSVRKVANLAGFQPVGTAALEYAEVLLGQGGETDKQVYLFQDNGKRDVGMRFDLTVPFARYVAEHQGTMVFPFKRLQIGDVWRAEKPQKGRYREFCQCDLDVIGVDSMAADVEILSCFQSIINDLDVGYFTQAVGNRLVLSALIKSIYPDVTAESEGQILIALDKLDKIGTEKVTDLLNQATGTEGYQGSKLISILTPKESESVNGGIDLSEVRKQLAGDDDSLAEVIRLEQTVNLARKLSQGGKGKISIDLRIARGLGYYTGVVFETTLDSLPKFGSISSGGRYNDLAERFCNRELAGVGGSLGLDRLVAAMDEMKKIGPVEREGVFIAVATEGAMPYAFEIAGEIRNSGIAADVALKSGKVGNQFKLAGRLGFSLVVTVGDIERQKETYSIKNLKSGEESRDLPVSNIIEQIKVNSQGVS